MERGWHSSTALPAPLPGPLLAWPNVPARRAVLSAARGRHCCTAASCASSRPAPCKRPNVRIRRSTAARLERHPEAHAPSKPGYRSNAALHCAWPGPTPCPTPVVLTGNPCRNWRRTLHFFLERGYNPNAAASCASPRSFPCPPAVIPGRCAPFPGCIKKSAARKHALLGSGMALQHGASCAPSRSDPLSFAGLPCPTGQ